MTTKTNKKGFTIIEVVLVLAIAGLIFLMVFLAWPALQNSQKDTQRRNDYSGLFANMENYLASLNGKVPTTSANLDETRFVNKTGNNPDGFPYVIKVAQGSGADGADISTSYKTDDISVNAGDASGDTSATKAEPVYVVFYSKCGADANGEPILVKTKNKKDFSVWGKLNSSDAKYCQSNS